MKIRPMGAELFHVGRTKLIAILQTQLEKGWTLHPMQNDILKC